VWKATLASFVILIDQAVFIDGHLGDVEAPLFQRFRRVQHREMLDGGNDDVLAAGLLGHRQAFDGQVIAFGAAGREDDFLRRRADQPGHLLASGFEGLSRPVPPVVER
jgi:hypothetical protein